MESIGLMPSSTGQPGGRRVGDCMADYVIPGGRFATEVDELLVKKGFAVTWFDRFTPVSTLYPVASVESLGDITAAALAVPAHEGVLIQPKPPMAPAASRSNRDKYTCPGCRLNVWGKPGLRVACIDCGLPLEVESADDLARTIGRAAAGLERKGPSTAGLVRNIMPKSVLSPRRAT